MALDVKPTRSQLIALRKKIKLSRSGYKILKMKRDGLIMEFFKILNEAKNIRQELVAKYVESSERIGIAEAVKGRAWVRSYALSRKADPEIQLGSQNIMGVVVPTIKAKSIRTRIDSRGFSMINPSIRIDEACDAFEELVELIIRAAEIETTMKKLLDEIDSTKRRVNALEFKVIPELEEAEAFVRLRLEEMERESTFRLKRIKGSS
ncbi:MAG: V-type ATP synthase subunit D [Planctomycetota bacterium]|jgi:V/A-type H+-transporting ATPase subunit D